MKEFNFKKKFGQNFLTDKNLLAAIVREAGITPNDEVLEIGPGMGALTKELLSVAKKVVAYEIDSELEPFLQELDCQKFKVIYQDVLKQQIEEIEQNFSGNFKLVANLPYYVTSPVIFKFLTQPKRLSSMTIMVQKEVGQRICAKKGDKSYGALSVCCSFFGSPKLLRTVSRKAFTPQPEVDSCVVRIDIENKFDLPKDKFLTLIKICFKSRRKTLLNNLSEGLREPKSNFDSLGFDLSKRAEEYSTEDFVCLCKALSNKLG